MALKAIFCLLSVSLANAMYTNPSLSSSLAGNIESLLSGPVPCTDDSCLSKCLKTLKGMRMETTTWEKEYNFAKLGLNIKLNYVDPDVPLTGAQVAVEFAVPELLRFFTFGLTELTLDAVIEAPKIMEGLFNVKIGYTAVRNGQTMQGLVNVLRVIEAGKYVTKFYVKDKDMGTMGMSISTDMMNKNTITMMYNGETYTLTLNRVRGNSLVASINHKDSDFSIVISPNMKAHKISVTVSQNKKEVIYRKEIVYNPISSEYAVYVDGDGQYGPLDCRVIVEKDLSYVQISVSHNKKTIVYLNFDGKVHMANTIPDFFKYEVTYDFLEGIYGEGRAKINFNARDAQKVFTIKLAPKNRSSYDFELKVTIDNDLSFEILHELTQDSAILYTASHKHTVAFNTAEKWSSIQKDKCVIPQKSSLFTLVKDTYLGSILMGMQRTMALNIDWRSATGLVPKVHYEDSILTNGKKHMAMTLNTMEVPFKLHLTYPVGPTLMGVNFGLLNLLGQDAVTCDVTYTPGQEIRISSDYDNMKATIRLPSYQALQSLSLDVTKTKHNEKVIELSLIKEGETVYKVNTFANINTPTIPHVCASSKGACQWSALVNFDIDLSQKILGLIPINTFTMSLTKDLESLLEIQQNMKKSPYFLRMTCPTFLPQPLDITIKHENMQSMTVIVADYVPGDITVDIIGTKHIVKYEGYELVVVDINMAEKLISFGMAALSQPTVILQFATNVLLDNAVKMTVNLPLVGHVLTINKNWLVNAFNDFRVKSEVLAILPVIGNIEAAVEAVAMATLPRGSMKLNVHGHFTEGLAAYLPHVDARSTINYNVKDMSATVLLNVNGIIIALTPKAPAPEVTSSSTECTFTACDYLADGDYEEGECQATYCTCSNGVGILRNCAETTLTFDESKDYCVYKTEQAQCTDEIISTGPYGGWSGVPFTDVEKRQNGAIWPIESIKVEYRDIVDGISVIYSGGQEGLLHGRKNPGGQEGYFNLAKNENIVKIKLSYEANHNAPADIIQHLEFHTAAGTVHGPFGTEQGTSVTVEAPRENCVLSYISGREGWYVDGLAFWWQCKV